MSDLNSVNVTANLTADPEIKQVGETYVTRMRVAINSHRKQAGQWVDKPNFATVEVWGAQAQSCAQFLKKGSKVGVSAELDYNEWGADDGAKRSELRLRAHNVAFLDRRDNQPQTRIPQGVGEQPAATFPPQSFPPPPPEPGSPQPTPLSQQPPAVRHGFDPQATPNPQAAFAGIPAAAPANAVAGADEIPF
jgi:single-strand DNA-binding protein